MKIDFSENQQSFDINFTAENVKDAAFLCRLSLNAATAKKISCPTFAERNGEITSHISIGKRRDWSGVIPNRKDLKK